MRIIIDIPEEIYNIAKDEMWCGSPTIGHAIAHGTPLNEAKMDKITFEIKNLIMNHGWLNYEDSVQAWRLLSVISSLHNELHKEVTGKYYDYMFHWANLGWIGDVNEDLFKEAGQHQENEKNNKLETWMNGPEEEGENNV